MYLSLQDNSMARRPMILKHSECACDDCFDERLELSCEQETWDQFLVLQCDSNDRRIAVFYDTDRTKFMLR